VKISGKKKQPHKEDPKPVSAIPCKEARKVGSEGTSPRSSGDQRNREEGASKKEKANNSQQSKEKSEKTVISQAARGSRNTAKMKATERWQKKRPCRTGSECTGETHKGSEAGVGDEEAGILWRHC